MITTKDTKDTKDTKVGIGRPGWGQRTIYVALLDEGTDVWRPVDAEELRAGLFRIISENSSPEDERWEFAPGSIVRCEQRKLSEGPALVAIARATVKEAAAADERRAGEG